MVDPAVQRHRHNRGRSGDEISEYDRCPVGGFVDSAAFAA